MKKINIYFVIILAGFCLTSCNKSKSSETIDNDASVKHQSLIPLNATHEGSLQSSAHPLSEKINQFLSVNEKPEDYKLTGLNKKGYLRIIDGQVRAMKKYQNSEGRIIDPVDKVEKYYTTPC